MSAHTNQDGYSLWRCGDANHWAYSTDFEDTFKIVFYSRSWKCKIIVPLNYTGFLVTWVGEFYFGHNYIFFFSQNDSLRGFMLANEMAGLDLYLYCYCLALFTANEIPQIFVWKNNQMEKTKKKQMKKRI